MSKSIPFKKLAMCSLMTAAMAAASQGAFAHTRLETSTVPEGTKVHNRINIGHGCKSTPTNNPTYGTNVVFPNAVSYTPVLVVDSGNGKEYASDQTASNFYAPLAGIGMYIRNGGPWDYAQIKADAKNNLDGFWAGGKSYDQTIGTPIQVDFSSAAVTINKDSCARSVTFELAIADICDASVPSADAADPQVLYWSPIPSFPGVPGAPFGTPAGNPTNTNLSKSGVPVGPAYSNYDGYEDAAHTLPGDGWGSPATLKVTRNLTTNPLPASCTGNGGLGDDVYVYPSPEQINNELPIWSGIHQGEGTNYWQ